ncbi:hypothetical protein [Actibacterium sp. MT2.3-13A]|uniref:hypothetical protein n=1 Tax=Actibacterium sp. MT2.3-13A TaxID=2828332 RepID=UPI001BAB5EFE|nr:hypothetical protein [Actibacterium sp. MT2.3-13A]
MEIVASTFLSLAAIAALMVMGPHRGLWLAMAMAPFGAAAAFNLPALGGASILALDLMAVTLFGLVILSRDGMRQVVGTMRMGQPGFWLLLLGLFCIMAALFLPRVFQGQTEVFSIARSEGRTAIISVPLRPNVGNLTQLFRIGLGVLAFLALATAFRRRPDAGRVRRAMIVVTCVHVALGWLDVISHAVGLPELLEPIRTANYAMLTESMMGGLKRMVGGFPEASSYGYLTLALFGFWLQYWVAGGRSRLGFWMLLATVVVLLRGTSSSAYVAAALFCVSFAGLAYLRRLRHRVHRRTAAVWAVAAVLAWLGAIGLFAAYQLVDPVAAYLDRALFQKLEGSSGVERMSWNAQAFSNFLETWMMGAGLGSIRASNWLLACLGSIGLIGTGLFLGFLGATATLREQGGDQERAVVIRALKAACLALFCVAMLILPTPDLGIFFFMLAGLAAGLARGGLLRARHGAEVARRFH